MIGLWHVAHLDTSPAKVDVPFCVSCGDAPTTEHPVAALGSVSAPYCADCVQRAKRSEWKLPLAFTVACALLGFVSTAIPGLMPDTAAEIVLALTFFGGMFVVGMESFGGSESKRAAHRDAVRAHRVHPKIQIDCARRDVADALVAACGGHVAPHRALRLTPAFAIVPLALVCAAIGIGLGFHLFSTTLFIDNGSEHETSVSLDGRTMNIARGNHTNVSVRTGRHRLRWNVGSEWRERDLDLDAHHDVLLNPGATICYWKEVGVYKHEAFKTLTRDEVREVTKAGPLPLEELYVLPTVKHWFEPMPDRKRDEALESNVDIGILRNDACTQLLQKECAPSVIEAFLQCQGAARGAEQAQSCFRSATAFCGAP